MSVQNIFLICSARDVHAGRSSFFASMQISAIKLLSMTEVRLVHIDEVDKAGSEWAIDLELHKHNPLGEDIRLQFHSGCHEMAGFQ